MPSREETLSVDVLDPGGTSTARYFLPPGTPMALAASGESILAAWQDVDGLHVGFVGDATGPLTDSDVPPGTTRILLDWNGSAYLAVWEASGVAAARIKTDGVVDPIVLGSDGGMQVGAAITLLDVETAGGTSLVLYEEAHGDGGTLVRGMRIDAAGTVLDPGGFDVAPGSGGDVAAVQPGLWLVATAEDVEGTHLIRGRFVGDTTVPTPPDNVELPVVDPPGVPTDGEAGVADAARPDAPRDAGDPPDAATDGAAQPGADAYEVPLSAPVRGDMPQGCSCRLAHGRPEAPISWNAVAGLALAALCAARARARPSGKDSADS